MCEKVGCTRLIERWKPGWKLCSTCLLNVVETGKSAKLKDGTEWHARKKALKLQLAQATRAGVLDSHLVASGGRSDDDFDDDEPQSGYAQRRAKRLRAIRQGRVSVTDDGDESLDDEEPLSHYADRKAKTARSVSTLSQVTQKRLRELRDQARGSNPKRPKSEGGRQ